MDSTGWIAFGVIGLLAGLIAGKIMKGRGFGLIGNLVIGVLGAYLGGILFSLLGISAGGFLGSLVMATAGAVALLFVVGLLKRA